MKSSFKEGDPLENWQTRFPLPESFSNPEFKRWVVGLDGDLQKRLGMDISDWYAEYLKTTSTPVDEQTKRHLDQFLGDTINMKNDPNWFPGLSSQRRGVLRRIAIEGMVERKLL